MRFRGYSFLDQIKRCIQPDDYAVIQDQLKFYRPSKRRRRARSPAAGPDCTAFTRLASADGFERAEYGLALLIENFADRGARAAFDFVVEIEETPAEFIGKGSSDSRLAAPHESYQVDSGRAFELKNHVVLTARARESDNGSMQPGLLPLFPLQVVLLPGPNCLCTSSKTAIKR